MKYLLLTTLTFVTLSVITFAQSNNELLVEYYACATISDDVEAEVVNFLDDVQTYLGEYQVRVTFQTGSFFVCGYSLPFADTRLIFGESIIDDVVQLGVNVSLSPLNLNRISPILGNERPLSINSIDRQSSIDWLAAILLYQVGEIDIAEAKLLEMLEDTNSPRALHDINYYLGNIALINGDYELAIERYNDYEWEYLPYYSVNFAWALLQRGDAQQAIEHMNEAVELYEGLPPHVLWITHRAQIYALSFDYTSAIDDMDAAIDFVESEEFDEELYFSIYISFGGIDVLRSVLYKQRGDIIMLIYEWNRALGDYNKAIELDPDYAEAYYRRGILYYTMVERENAIADFETYLELDPDGQFIAFSEQFIVDIQTELDALGG